MEGEMKNLIYVCSSVIASLTYCYFVSSKISPGLSRFLSVLPIFCLFIILPYYVSSAFNTALITFFTTWLSNSKLLLFCFGHGPLSSPNHSLAFFISIASLPIRVKPNMTSSNTETRLLPSLQLVVFTILVKVLYSYREAVHHKMIQCLYCCLCFLLIDILIAFSSTLAGAVGGVGVGFEFEPASKEPYLSTSLQDFWGKRWNLTVTTTLRDTIYRPVRRASEIVLGKKLAPVAAVMAAFLVSGLMHELLFYNVTRSCPSWEMTMFFVLHGICVVVEVGLKNWVQGRGWRLPWPVSTGLTLGFVLGTSLWLFFPPLIRSGADTRVLEEMTFFVESLWTHLTKLFSSIYK